MGASHSQRWNDDEAAKDLAEKGEGQVKFDGLTPKQAAEKIRDWWEGRVDAADFDMERLSDYIAEACEHFCGRRGDSMPDKMIEHQALGEALGMLSELMQAITIHESINMAVRICSERAGSPAIWHRCWREADARKIERQRT